MSVESRELAEFREQWKAEIKQRSRVSHSHRNAGSQSALTVDQEGSEEGLTSSGRIVSSRTHAELSVAQPRISKAVETYQLAIQFEQAGDLDEALRLYRNAFKLDSNVDKAYRREEQLLEAATVQQGNVSTKEHLKAVLPVADMQKIARTISKARMVAQKRMDAGILIHLLAGFPSDLDFIPVDESCGTPLRFLPHEIVILILKALDPSAIERFALLSRKARVLSLDSSIWRNLVQRTYMPPQIPHDVAIETLVGQYSNDYRRFYIEHPRLRLDGVYIAVCHYVRPGMNSDNVWVNVSHLITYHRYLRFFADGSVLSLLANEDVEPQSIIHLLKPTLRMKGLFIGNWTLEGTTILVRDLTDPSGGHARYTFQMSLKLKSKPLGRWNKLDLAGYDSVNKENGEAIPVGLKHERPFWFSKVRSFAA